MKNYFTLTALSLLASCLITHPSPTPAATATTTSTTPQIVDMGGILIELKPYARDVEFNQTQTPNRPPQLRSLGFYLQYPELIPATTGNIAPNYISINVYTGDNYPNHELINRRFQALLTRTPDNYFKNYEKLPQQQYGLDVYTPIGTDPLGIDPKAYTPLRNHPGSVDLFVKMTNNGALAQITCSNSLVPSPPCSHHFSLSPHSKALVYVSYPRANLPEWHTIQTNVQKLLLDMATPPALTSKPRAHIAIPQ